MGVGLRVRLRLRLVSSRLVSSRQRRKKGKETLPSKGYGPISTVNPLVKKYRAADRPTTTGQRRHAMRALRLGTEDETS